MSAQDSAAAKHLKNELAEHFDGRRGGGDGPEDKHVSAVFAVLAELDAVKSERDKMRKALEFIADGTCAAVAMGFARQELNALAPKRKRSGR